ncbi:SixA phosphatase family protein [Alkalilimnicola sp. S0819]|nr:histidine phosphatase family protein [Alkalilimnicola sp. S0819]
MRELILIRHAEAQAHGGPGGDFQRPLSERGEQDAAMLGRRLAQRALHPDRFSCSSALRALGTARLVAAGLGVRPERLLAEERLYLASAGDLLAWINALPDSCRTVLLVAHNPGLAELATIFTGRALRGFPPGTALGLRFPLSHWASLTPGDARFEFVELPAGQGSQP